ncbi:MAG: TonB-dependent receptor [Bacteroidales bacterium]|nr:TonB-dependent receptor [Bacteroidales bacterium]
MNSINVFFNPKGLSFKTALLAILMLGFSSISHSQDCLHGFVTDAGSGLALEGANILVIGHSGTSTDRNGGFRLCGLQNDTVSLKVSCIGYSSKEVNIYMPLAMGEAFSIKLVPSVISINEVVVTSTRTDNNLLNSAGRVNLLPSRLLRSTPSLTIDEALKYVPGVNWSRPFGIFSTKATVTMRGLSGKEQGRVLIMLDGVPINKSDGGTVDWNMVDMDRISRVEVTKGAGSALYGGNAMGGVINMITQPPQKDLTTKFSLEYGSFNTAAAKLSVGGRMLKNKERMLYYSANTFYRKSDGYVTQSPADVKANPYVIPSDLMEFGAGLTTGYQIKKYQVLTATINYYNDHRGTGEKVYLEDGNVTDHDSYGLTVSYKGSIGKLKLNTSAYSLTENYKKVNEYLKDDYTWYDVLSVRRDNGLNANLSGNAGKFNLITGGFDFRNGSVDAYDKYFTSTDIVYNEGKMNTFALYVQDEISFPSEHFKVIAGLRYDRANFYDGSFRIEDPSMETSFMNEYQVPDMPEQTWNALSPRISAQYRWNKENRAYLQYSRGFRPSVLDDLCRSGRIKGGFKIANPDIRPEYLNNFETGMDISLPANIYANASLFYSRGKDFQYYVSNGQTIDMGFGDRPIFIRANISDVEIMGTELEVRENIGDYLSLFASYSYTHSVIKDYRKIALNDTIDLSGKFFTDVPEHIFTAGLNFSHPWINAGIWLHYTGSMYINDQNVWDEILLSDQYPGYTTVDLKISRTFREHWKAGLNLQNLFDVKYYDSKYAVCPGRFITLQVSYQL